MRFASARSVWDVVAPDTPFFDAMFRSGDGHRWAYSHPLAATQAVSCMTFASTCDCSDLTMQGRFRDDKVRTPRDSDSTFRKPLRWNSLGFGLCFGLSSRIVPRCCRVRVGSWVRRGVWRRRWRGGRGSPWRGRRSARRPAALRHLLTFSFCRAPRGASPASCEVAPPLQETRPCHRRSSSQTRVRKTDPQ